MKCTTIVMLWNNKEVIESLLLSILFDYLELMMSAVPQVETDMSTDGQHKVLFRRFLELLTTRHVKHQLVDTYAQELCVSHSASMSWSVR